MQNVTAIDDLPELEDLEGPRPMYRSIRPGGGPRNATPYGQDILPPKNTEDVYRKYIREGRNIQDMHHEAGMRQIPPGPAPMYPSMDQIPMEYFQPPEQDINGLHQGMEPKWKLPDGSPSCIDVANHIASCPVCAQIYNNDKTIYIVSIIVLVIVCLLLLKKVLDV